MSEFELARRIRLDLENVPTRLVALNGTGQDADVQNALEATRAPPGDMTSRLGHCSPLRQRALRLNAS